MSPGRSSTSCDDDLPLYARGFNMIVDSEYADGGVSLYH
jgi:hypothetical protein